MIAFLLSVGYGSFEIGIARTMSTVAELSATWISPRVMKRLGAIRTGSVSVAWQAAWLTLGVVVFLAGAKFAVTGLIGGVVLSRIGLWGFDLAVQYIIQEVSARFLLPPFPEPLVSAFGYIFSLFFHLI
jgi:iron-regulated transporter 1